VDDRVVGVPLVGPVAAAVAAAVADLVVEVRVVDLVVGVLAADVPSSPGIPKHLCMCRV
jgi:hypothetical protein